MKCLKNQKTGNIVRVSDQQANQMTGSTWQYIPKSEWKAATRKPEPIAEDRQETISKKQLNRKKNVQDRSK